jgi:hypothetical protein
VGGIPINNNLLMTTSEKKTGDFKSSWRKERFKGMFDGVWCYGVAIITN